jgi:hypothetical protein
MIFPNIFGSYEARDLPSIRIGNGATMEQVMADLRRFADFFDAAVQVYENALATRGSDEGGSFGTGTGGGELQPYTELGETEATRTEFSEWLWNAPIRRWRDRQIYTEEYLLVETLQTIARDTIAAMNRYLSTRLKMLLRALLRNTNYDWFDREFPGNAKGNQLRIYSLFNADGNTGRMWVNNAPMDTGALQHYLSSGAAGITLANFTLGRDTLRDIGHTGRVVHLVSPADEDTVKALPGFIATPPAAGDIYARDVPAAPTTQAVVTRPRAIGTIANGGVSDGEIVVFPFWPANYTFSYDATKGAPLFIRTRPEANFQGFRLVQDQTRTAYGDGDLRNKRWEFIGGAAVQNRANGVVVQGTAGAYAVPTV